MVYQKYFKANYKVKEVHHTSGALAIKAGCDISSLIDIMGKNQTIEMFKNVRRYDVFKENKNDGIIRFFDEVLNDSYLQNNETYQANQQHNQRFN